MVDKMERLLLAIVFTRNLSLRKATVGEVSRALKKPHTTVYRNMKKAEKAGLVESSKFNRGKMVCYEFELTQDGSDFLNSFSQMF